MRKHGRSVRARKFKATAIHNAARRVTPRHAAGYFRAAGLLRKEQEEHTEREEEEGLAALLLLLLLL